MYQLLLLALVLFVACIVLNFVSKKLSILLLLGFLGMGVIFCQGSLLPLAFDNITIPKTITSIALVLILFYAGTITRFEVSKPVLSKAIVLSVLGVIGTILLLGLFARFALGFGWIESFILGAVLSAIDPSSVISLLRNKKLNLKNNTASFLQLESSLCCPLSFFFLVVLLVIYNGQGGGWTLPLLLVTQTVGSAFVGFFVALITSFVLKKMTFRIEGMGDFLVLSVALLSYLIPSLFNGNGFLSVLVAGFWIGNHDVSQKSDFIHRMESISSILQLLVLFILGMQISLDSFLPLLLLGLFLSVFLVFVVRPLLTFGCLAMFRGTEKGQKLVVMFAGLRGIPSVVFSFFAASQMGSDHQMIQFVFITVAFSMIIQGLLVPVFSRVVHMIDDSEEEGTSFTDYSEYKQLPVLETTLSNNHPWVGKTLDSLELPPDIYLVSINRRGFSLNYQPELVLENQDRMVFASISSNSSTNGVFYRYLIKNGSDWMGKTLSQIVLPNQKLIVAILRSSSLIPAKGDTVLQMDDAVIFIDEH